MAQKVGAEIKTTTTRYNGNNLRKCMNFMIQMICLGKSQVKKTLALFAKWIKMVKTPNKPFNYVIC